MTGNRVQTLTPVEVGQCNGSITTTGGKELTVRRHRSALAGRGKLAGVLAQEKIPTHSATRSDCNKPLPVRQKLQRAQAEAARRGFELELGSSLRAGFFRRLRHIP